MKLSIVVPIIITSILSITACSSSNDDSDAGDVVVEDDMNTGGTDTEGAGEGTDTGGTDTEGMGEGTDTGGTETEGMGEGTDTGGTETEGMGEGTDTEGMQQPGDSGVALFGQPQFMYSECGSDTVSESTATNSLDVNEQAFVGQPVRGQVLKGSDTENFDIWQITLNPGNYHLVADTWPASEERTNVGLEIDSLGDTTADDVRLVRDTASDFDMRLYSYLEIANTETLRIRVEPIYDAPANYVMGVYGNGTAVPSPRFTRCFSATTISLAATQSVLLPELNDFDDYRWYRMELSEGTYQLDASTTSVDSVNLGYEVTMFSQFTQDQNAIRVTRDTESGTSLVTSDEFTLDDNQTVWFRLESIYDDQNVEFTIVQLP